MCQDAKATSNFIILLYFYPCTCTVKVAYLITLYDFLCRILPEMVASILSDSFRRERVLSQCDASDVLRDAFLQTEACMDHYYEVFTET